MTGRIENRILRIIIPVLALADGTIHLLLNFILFGGQRGAGPGGGGPPPGRVAPPPRTFSNPLILPLNDLFILNFVGAVLLVLVFWFGRRWLGERQWVVSVLMIAYAAATFVTWWIFGRPNPMGLGYLSKGIEITLILALLVNIWQAIRPRTIAAPAS